MPIVNVSLATGTISGTLLSITVCIDLDDLLKTTMLAATGAVVSFIVSYFLKRLFQKKKN